jgi:IclR family transcriptional regulator, pca regulon regulatory protein
VAGELVQSLARGLAVIRAFDASHRHQTLNGIADATGLSHATAQRLLRTLMELGYVRSEDGRYVLTPRVLELGYGELSNLTLPTIAEPHLERLAARIDESCSVAILAGSDVVYVARASRKRIMAASIAVGTRLPAWVTALGRVLMAAQPDQWIEEYLATALLVRHTERTVTDRRQLRQIITEVRLRGYATVDRELEPVLRSVAAPIRERGGAVVAAMNIASPAGAGDVEETRRSLLPMLLGTIDDLERDLRVAAKPMRCGSVGGSSQQWLPVGSIDVPDPTA